MLSSREKFLRRQQRSRAKLRKTAEGKARLSVARSGKNISAQIIDDENMMSFVNETLSKCSDLKNQ